jgi:hypothetical protein
MVGLTTYQEPMRMGGESTLRKTLVFVKTTLEKTAVRLRHRLPEGLVGVNAEEAAGAGAQPNIETSMKK